MWYLIWLAATGRVNHIELKFMIKGHTHFIVDSGIGHAKRELRRSNVFCLNHWTEVINRSSATNEAKIVNGHDVYQWKDALTPYFRRFEGISKFQHFAVDKTEPGFIWAKYDSSDAVWKKKNLLMSSDIIHTDEFKNLPKHISTVGFKGGELKKETMLFENLRIYVKDKWKDELCPDPKTFKPPIRKEKTCPDWQ